MAVRLSSLLAGYARWAAHKPAVPLVVLAGLCALAGAGARNLRLDARFEALLPQETPSVQARNEARRRVGSSDMYVIAVESPDPEANFRFARDLSERIGQWDETEWVMHELDLDVFREHALLYMDLEDLTSLVDLMELRVGRFQCEARRDCTETDLRTDGEVRADDDRLRALAKQYRARANKTAGDRASLGEAHPELRDALMNDDGSVAVVAARLSKGTSDMDFARDVYLRGEALVAELDPSSYHEGMRARVSGAYQSFREYDTVLRDAGTASAVSLGLVVLAVVLFFRRLRTVILVAAALVVGVAWTMGVTGLIHPTLNTITAFIFAILLGMGIDFAIHLCAATRAARSPETELPEALAQGVRETAPGMLTSALTTAAALLTLSTAHSRGFQEFGIIGSVGVLLCLAAAELVIPPLWGLLDRVRPDTKTLPVPRDRWFARRAPTIAAALGVGLTALFAWRAPSVQFEYDFSRLRAPRSGTGIGYGKALRFARCSSPAMILGDSEAQLRLAHRQLTERQEGGDERIRDVITLETFVPTEQEEKLEELERLADLLRPRTIKRVPREHRERLEELSRLAEVEEPVTLEHIPPWAQRTVRERDGTLGQVGVLCTWMPRSDARESMQLQQDLAGLGEVEGRPARLAYSRFVIADVVHTVQQDGLRMFLIAAAAVLLLLIFDLRSITGAILCVLALLLGVTWGLGAAQLVGWKLGVYNMLVVPLALGLGIDGSVHIYHRYKRLGADFAKSPLGVTGLAVLASSVTTVAGFAGLLFIEHQGLGTIGQLAVLAVGATLVSVLGFLPGVLVILARRKARRPPPGDGDK